MTPDLKIIIDHPRTIDDAVTRLMFILTERDKEKIRCISRENLLWGMHTPNGIAVDSADGKMYWTDFETGKIHRTNLDGSSAECLISSGLFGPAGIAVCGHVPVQHRDFRGGCPGVADLRLDGNGRLLGEVDREIGRRARLRENPGKMSAQATGCARHEGDPVGQGDTRR